MQRIFRREVYGLIAAGILMMGVFAELEDEVLKKIDDHSVASHDWHLMLLRVIRSIVIISIGVLLFAALGAQF